MRVHVLSSHVSLALSSSLPATSALNVLTATIIEIKEVDQSMVDVLLDVGCPLVASITRKSLLTLDLRPGQRLCAQIKAVALIEELTD